MSLNTITSRVSECVWKMCISRPLKYKKHLEKLKLVSFIFYQFFYFFTKWEPFKNYEKCFLFHLKSSFCSGDIQIFVIFSLLLHSFQIQNDKWEWNNHYVINWLAIICRYTFYNNSLTALHYITKLGQIIYNK